MMVTTRPELFDVEEGAGNVDVFFLFFLFFVVAVC